jgi:hypothetical protein
MLPMAGCDIVQSSEKLTFTIRHMNRSYQTTVGSEADHAEWMAALILSANAKLPGERAPQSPTKTTSNPKKTSANGHKLLLPR